MQAKGGCFMEYNKIDIKEKIKKEQIEEGYYITIFFMYGDGDGEADRRVGPFYKEEETKLLEFINILSNS